MTIFDVMADAAVEKAASDEDVEAAAAAFVAEATRAIPGDWRDRDALHTAAMAYAHELAVAAFCLGWELRGDPDRLHDLHDTR